MTDRKPMNPLQQLIADYLRDNPDESYASIGRRGGLSRQTVRDNATKEQRRQTPHQPTVEGLARGMKLPLDLVKEAASEAAGYHKERGEGIDSPSAVVMWEEYALLDEDRRAEVEARVRYLLTEMHEEASRTQRKRPNSGGKPRK